MLDAKADRERLGFHVNTARVQHAEGFTCAVAEREDDVIGFEYFAARERHAVDAAVFDTHVGDLLFEAHFTAERFEQQRSEEHTSELQSLMRISYAVFCLKKKKKTDTLNNH